MAGSLLGARSGSAPVRLGVAGCGVIAYWTHLRELPRVPGAALVAAADCDGEARERARRLTGLPVHEQTSELVARDDVDGVVVCVPPAQHAEVAIAAARAGKHVYVEKPLATTPADARRVAEAIDASGVVGAVGFNRRRHPAYEQARALVASGRIGRVRAVLSAFCEPSPAGAMPAWKRARTAGGGVLLDLASHHVDAIGWLLDDAVVEVECSLESDASEHDGAWLRLAYAGGAEARSFFSFRSARTDTVELVGERGTLRIDRHRPWLDLRVERRLGYGVRRALVLPTRDALAWRAARLVRPSWESSYRRALAAFVGAIRGGPRLLATARDGVANLEVLAAAEESARLATPVSLLPRRDRAAR